MNSIKTDQNTKEFIDLLKAQRVAYSLCKKFQFFDIVSVMIAIIFPIVALKAPEYQNSINAFGVLWTVAYLIAEIYRKRKSTEGATIQEEFDTKLYDMEWNEILCGNKLSIDSIQELSSKYDGNDLKDWYSTKIDDSLPKEVATILCQRINFSWEITQRKKFVFLLTVLALIYYLIYIIIGFIHNIGFFDFLILLSPSIPFLVFSVQNILSIRSHITSKNDTLKIIDDELGNYAEIKKTPTSITLRQIQDKIYNERVVTEKIPDWFYRLKKSENENSIDNLIIKIQNKF